MTAAPPVPRGRCQCTHLADGWSDSHAGSWCVGRLLRAPRQKTPSVGHSSWSYRHIDTAQGYGNEQSVGEGFRQSDLERDQVFITTKFYPGAKDPVREIEASLQRLRLEYVDLYLVHWPQGGPTWAWPGMERAQSLGYARSIGVSNFDVDELEQVFAAATSPPVANQINLNPFSSRKDLVEENRRRNLATEAYSPLGTGRHLGNPRVQEIADRVGRSTSQVLIRWGLQHDFVILPKSTHRERTCRETPAPLASSLSVADMDEPG